MVAEAVWLGLACLAAPAISEYFGFRKNAERGFHWVAVAGVLFILAGAFSFATTQFLRVWGIETIGTFGELLFSVLGWLFVLVGVIVVLVNSLRLK
jgi:hypothetical protein